MAIELIEDPDMDEGSTQEQQQHPADFLRSIMKMPNIIPVLESEVVSKIGNEVKRGFDRDMGSRSEWIKQTKIAMDLAMQVTSEKSWPWPNAANIKYPMITTAAIQFSARAYPAIVAGQDVVKGEVLGPDPQGTKKERADRIGRHMSYQVLEEIEDWDEEEDKLLLMMAIVGCVFRKTYFDTMLGRPCSDLASANDVVFDHSTPWKKQRRITHCLNLFKNDVVERVRGGLFTDIELGMPEGVDNDEDAHYKFLECHCWYDLDGDGYKEPYVVTIKQDTAEVVRIIARFDEDGIYLNDKDEITKIKEVHYFTKFGFMPNPDGGSTDIGLGLLLNPINEATNTVFNQMLDAGTRQITGGGFIGSGLKMKGGTVRFAPGEYKPIEATGGRIQDNIYHMESQGPSPVMFQLLGMLIQASKEMSSVQDIMTGEQQTNQTATTTMALIEQGQKVFSAIYKRVHRSLKLEFKKIYRLNRLYLLPQDYYRFQDRVETVYLQDYQGDDTDVAPVSDPTLVSDAQNLMRAESLMKFIGDPFFDQLALRKNYLKAMKEQNPEGLLIKDAERDLQKKFEQLQQQAGQMQEQLQKMQQGQQAVDKQSQQVALNMKDIEAGLAELAAVKSDLALREQLAMQKIDEQVTRGEIDAKMREAKINQMASEKLENIAQAEAEAMRRMMGKSDQGETNG